MSLPLVHFLRRAQSIALYRALLRKANGAPKDARDALRLEIRREFEVNRKVVDENQHLFLLAQGNKKLADLEQMLALTRTE